MKHRWTTLLWELFAAQVLCTAAAMLPGSRVCTMPGLALPALGLAAAVPPAWFAMSISTCVRSRACEFSYVTSWTDSSCPISAKCCRTLF